MTIFSSSSLNDKRSSLGMQLMSDQKRRDLRDLFNSFDIDKDGKISHAEFQQVLAATGVDSHSVMTIVQGNNKKNDRGDDVFYSYEEFVKLFRPTLSTPGRRTAKEQEMVEAFHAFDCNGDGVITHEELRLTLQQLGEHVSEQEAKDIIAEVDENEDGVVSFNEFLHMMGMRASSSSTEPKTATTTSTKTNTTRKDGKDKKGKHRFQAKLKRIFRSL
ncbi:hypothetical protein BDB00DRAFT_182984 [Zychaea mexicana]|uniref:uncharacterized protein n=1 Tax=Zychaea mexicana TaxID=64656 RepID=UPI0022FEE3BD|nr:uncharacterized protein BDB00DRAFT_182984 [Zychaea mexicana]KAI9479512.1 hypothetical protein BDB00DRAFT_182984 [Zychaea mexicana]